jgi:hypothetical protein
MLLILVNDSFNLFWFLVGVVVLIALSLSLSFAFQRPSLFFGILEGVLIAL